MRDAKGLSFESARIGQLGLFLALSEDAMVRRGMMFPSFMENACWPSVPLWA
jgi:hypothetical protein